MSGRRPEALAILGPTATGKTALAVRTARRLDGEVISVDSRQAYRGLEVGTAAPTPDEREAVPHHGVAFLDPRERYGAGRFARLARRWIAEIRARDRVPILAGGTGFFLDALVRPTFREPKLDAERRRRLRGWLEDRDPGRLVAWASRLDPEIFRRLETVDPQRAARTLELALLTGRPVTWWQDHGAPEAPPLPVLAFVLELPSADHRRRIERRAEASLEAGWPEEAARLREAGPEDAPALEAVGYEHVLAWHDGRIDREEAVGRIARDTWAYARRQRTWFRNRAPEGAVRLDARRPVEQLARRMAEAWIERASGSGGSARRAAGGAGTGGGGGGS